MVRVVRFIVELLPRLYALLERGCVWVATEGFHKPGFYLSTAFVGAAGLRLWQRPVEKLWRRIPLRILAYFLMVMGAKLFFSGPGILLIFLLPGRLFRRIFRWLGFDESREPPEVPRDFTFTLTRMDKAALIFIGAILLVFFLNRDQLIPKDDSDHRYHMAVAREILEQHRIPDYDNWEYAPAGRPHLYPPALHLAIAAFSGRPEKIEDGFQTLAVLTYPFALFLTWWFIRWLFGERMGLAGALFFSMDMFTGWTMMAVLPSAVVTALIPLILMCFLTKRKAATVLLLALGLYTHFGVTPLVMLGLFIFSARYRGYYAFFKSVFTWTFVLYLPWILHVLPQLGWMGMPMSRMAEAMGPKPGVIVMSVIMGMLMLQVINPVLMGVQMWGLFRFRHPAAGFLRCMLVGFLPMLLLYGGRFWMHTGPIWAVFAASVVVGLLPEGATKKRIAALALCTMIPLPIFWINVQPGQPVKVMPNIGGGTIAAAYVLMPAQDDEDFGNLKEFIEKNTRKSEIVHVNPPSMYLGDRIVEATGRRVDVGGWAAEVRNHAMDERVAKYREIDTDCLFVYENAEVPAELRCDRVEKFGRFNVGIRGKTTPLEAQRHPDEKES